MKKILLSAAAFAVVVVSAVAVAPTTSEAVPAFARQTGAACLSCHFQAIPKLTTMGRNFSLSGMLDMGEGALIEDDALSLPASFNAAFLMKIRIQSATDAYGTPGASTALQYPDETALLFGGRYGEHFGGLTEFAIMPKGSGIAQSKMSYVFEMDAGVVALDLFSGDLGAGWAFADVSNSVRHNTRSSQMRAGALEKTIMMKQALSGFGVHTLLNDSIYVAGGLYAAAGLGDIGGDGAGGGDLSQLSPYVRAAYIMEVAGLEMVAGGFYTSMKEAIAGGTAAGNATVAAGPSATQYGVDFQLQGDVGPASVGFYLPWVIQGQQAATAGVASGVDVTGGQAMVNVAFGHAGVKLGYDMLTTETTVGNAVTSVDTNTVYVGAWYSVAQNLELDLAYTSKTVGTAAATNATQLVIEYVY